MMPRGVSVIVCCYNSTNRIEPTLKHLIAQEVRQDVPWEVIIVNNNSSDNTADKAEAIMVSADRVVSYKICDQPIPGLSHARDMGIEQAQFPYLIFCDDDNWLRKDYVQLMHEILDGHHEVGAVGGCGIGEYEAPVPAWFMDFEKNYAIGPQGKTSGDVTEKKGCLYGAGMGIRKSVLFELRGRGFVSTLTGRKGAALSSGEDTELTYAIRLLGHRLWYDERLTFRHCIPATRITKIYVKNLRKEIAKSSAALTGYLDVLKNNERSQLRIFKETVKFMLKNFRTVVLNLGSSDMAKREHSKWLLRIKWLQVTRDAAYRRQIMTIHKWLRR